ncbi:MAG: VPLPA-CTERM sorting domain-containing protein [Gammaproteobacteria bacterium]|nr:VPLPA-CTERM sorting domain-containing protein [Gammaproteobacteria bacterium]
MMQGGRHTQPWVFLLISGLATLPAAATTLTTLTLNGSGAMNPSFQYLWNSPTFTTGNDYLLGVPGQYTFSDSFLTQQPQSPNLGTSTVGPYDFQDSYRFTIGGGAAGDVLTASLGLGNTFNIENLQFRLYEVASGTTDPIVGGVPPGSTLVQSWMGNPGSGTGVISQSFSAIQPGTYILDIAGIADGTHGGTYIGQLNLAPVPLPAALWLLASGLGVCGVSLRRRSCPP